MTADIKTIALTDKLRFAKEHIAELEAELKQCLDCCKRVGNLEDSLNRIYKIADNSNPSIDLIWQIAKKTIQGEE